MSPQNQNKIDEIDAVFSLSRALIVEAFPALRAALIKWKNDEIYLFFYCDGEISEEDRESCECVATEVVADFNCCNHIEVNILRLDYSSPIPNTGTLVYMRREPKSSCIPPKHEIVIPPEYKNDPEKSLSLKLRIAAIYGLRGQVSPALRIAKVKWDKQTIDLFFYYDGEISEEDNKSAKCVGSNVISYFPGYNLQINISRVDYPDPIRDETATTIYRRREPTSKE